MRNFTKAALGIGLAFTLASCSSTERSVESAPSGTIAAPTTTEVPSGRIQPNTAIECIADAPEDWTAPMSGLNVQAIAEALGVSQEEVVSGRMGPATCDKTVPYEESITTVTSVKGIGRTCLSIGVMSDTPPDNGQLFSSLVFICPGELEAI